MHGMKNYSNDNIKENNVNDNIKGIRLAGVKKYIRESLYRCKTSNNTYNDNTVNIIPRMHNATRMHQFELSLRKLERAQSCGVGGF